MDDNNLFLKKIEDRFQRFQSSYAIENGDFLSLEEQSKAGRLMRSLSSQGAFFYGGYDEAERRLPIFMPDYTGVKDEKELLEYFMTYPDECPLCILKVSVPRQEGVVLGHRDYLGALMGEGIKREKIGDILVHKDHAQIILLKELGEYLKDDLSTVGRASVNTELLTIDQVDPGEIKKELRRYNLASPRLDNVISSVFNLSRKAAQEAISRGLVFIDGTETVKSDYQLKPNQKIVLRGKGKAIYLDTDGTSRKGKVYINVIKYI
ncbi:MAG: hypothetical protein K5653_10055 [Clostridiales bacterium]|nr:hypothetical protein [Clostridiales bacterium]